MCIYIYIQTSRHFQFAWLPKKNMIACFVVCDSCMLMETVSKLSNVIWSAFLQYRTSFRWMSSLVPPAPGFSTVMRGSPNVLSCYTWVWHAAKKCFCQIDVVRDDRLRIATCS